MRIAIAGGHGKVARHLSRALAARGDVPVALVRQLAHVQDVGDDGAEPVVLDLERANARDVAEAVAGADAVVFAAGAGPGSGADRKDSVDRAAAALLAEGAEQDLRARELAWTILRPGALTDDPASGTVALEPSVARGAVPRADVAAVVEPAD